MIAMLRSLLLTTLVFFAAGGATADDVPATPDEPSLFEVEILVFTNSATAPRLAEQTEQTAAENAPKPPEAGLNAQVTPLRPEALRLGGVRARLDRLPGYVILLHSGWSQTLQDERSARGVALIGTPANQGLTGTVTTYRGRFVHIALDLTLPTPKGPTAAALLRQSRRVKAGALHYFDNPAFGAIVVIRPATAAASTQP